MILLAITMAAHADTVSYTGNLSSATDTYQLTFSLASPFLVSVQTWGFGGGVNAAGNTVAPGGFDPLIAFFDSAGNLVNINGDPNNPAGTSDTLSNFGSFVGCPPAGTVNIGGAVCGDISMSFTLAPGSYTLLLVDANYMPLALFDPTARLADGFFDFTGGEFQTCNIDSSGNLACITPAANWAFDLTLPTQPTQAVPEPATLALLAAGLGVGWWRRPRRR